MKHIGTEKLDGMIRDYIDGWDESKTERIRRECKRIEACVDAVIPNADVAHCVKHWMYADRDKTVVLASCAACDTADSMSEELKSAIKAMALSVTMFGYDTDAMHKRMLIKDADYIESITTRSK